MENPRLASSPCRPDVSIGARDTGDGATPRTRVVCEKAPRSAFSMAYISIPPRTPSTSDYSITPPLSPPSFLCLTPLSPLSPLSPFSFTFSSASEDDGGNVSSRGDSDSD